MKSSTNATPLPDYVVRLEYDSGEIFELEFKSVVERGGIFARLAPLDVFNQLRVGERGPYIEWPGGIDFCADALYQRAAPPAHANPA